MPKYLIQSLLLLSVFAVLQSPGLAQANPVQTASVTDPGATQFLPGHVTTTTVHSGTDDGTTASAKSHKGYSAPGGFLSTTTSTAEGYTVVEYKGLVEGAAVRVPTWNEDAAAGVQEQYGGKIDSYTHLCEEARVQAFGTMVERAKELGANGVLGIHFDSQVMPLDKGKFATGVVCVGTAVEVRRK